MLSYEYWVLSLIGLIYRTKGKICVWDEAMALYQASEVCQGIRLYAIKVAVARLVLEGLDYKRESFILQIWKYFLYKWKNFSGL